MWRERERAADWHAYRIIRLCHTHMSLLIRVSVSPPLHCRWRTRCSHQTVPDSIRLTQSSPPCSLKTMRLYSKSLQIHLITKSLPREQLASYRQQPCLFAWSTSQPAPFLAVSTWYSHSRDQPNSATVLPSKVNSSATEYERTPTSLYNKHHTIFYFQTVASLK